MSLETTYDALYNIDEWKGSGPEKVPPVCPTYLVVALFHIFNFSLSVGVFLQNGNRRVWYVPILKFGSINKIENYRGIAILSTFRKLFKSLVTSFLTYQITVSIAINQHWFVLFRSVITNLNKFVKFCVGKIENSVQIDVIYTDIKKALVVLKKLHHLGILHWHEFILTLVTVNSLSDCSVWPPIRLVLLLVFYKEVA